MPPDTAPGLCSTGGSYYLHDAAADARTRCYITPRACWLAWERGERYTALAYAALTKPLPLTRIPR